MHIPTLEPAKHSPENKFPEMLEATKSFKGFPLGWLAKQNFINYGQVTLAYFFREPGHGRTERSQDKLDRVVEHLPIVINNLVKYRDRFPAVQVEFTAQVLKDVISLASLRMEVMEQNWYYAGLDIHDSRRVKGVYEIEKKDSDRVVAKCKQFLSALGVSELDL